MNMDLTFRDLYNATDFSRNVLLNPVGSAWEVEVGTYKGENITLYKREFLLGNYIKRATIYFGVGDIVHIWPVNGYDGVTDLRVPIDTKLKDDLWFFELFVDRDLGKECSDFLLGYTEALTAEIKK